MKKILALVLATLMILSAVSALADGMPGPSKTAPFIRRGDTDETEIGLKAIDPDAKLQAIIDAITAANEEGDALKGLPEDVAALIPAEHTTINELSCWQLDGDVSGVEKLELVFTFPTPFTPGDEVTILIGISPADADVEWIVKTGVASDDGAVVVEVTADELAKISNNPFIVVPVSK